MSTRSEEPKQEVTTNEGLYLSQSALEANIAPSFDGEHQVKE